MHTNVRTHTHTHAHTRTRTHSHTHTHTRIYAHACACLRTPTPPSKGAGEAIPAFEEAVRGMAAGGLRRLEIPGELVEELAYPIAPKATRYNAGPVPKT